MGNSLSRRSYDVNYIDRTLNTKSINIGSEAQHFLITNAIFNEYIIKKELRPKKTLIVTISPWQFSEIKEKWWLFLQMASLDELSYSRNYFSLLNTFYSINDYPKVMSETVRFHSDLSKEIIETNARIENFKKVNPKGFTLNISDELSIKERNSKKDLRQQATDYSEKILKSNEVRLDLKEEESILNIINKSKEHKINLLFITPPSIENIYNKHGQGIIKYIKNLLAKHKANYFDLNESFNQMNLSFDDFSDYSHLNARGSRKIAPYIASILEKGSVVEISNKTKKFKNIYRKKSQVKLLGNHKTWGKVRIVLEKELLSTGDNEIFNLKRTSYSESSFIHTKPIEVNGVKKYLVNIKVKKGNYGLFFGIRIQGKYPQRVDAVFNLEEGVVYGIDALNGFKVENYAIKELENNWYNISLAVEVDSEDLRIILGPTSKENKILSWEGNVTKENDIYIIPSSLTIEEVF
ncbi:MAG: hypothetical protein ABJH82_11885 [Polaribacter sp.]|uniref:hypothetical protein n=1 Tax=Polaribacter sp. TaxID=1920175 RepID=UPI0032679232